MKPDPPVIRIFIVEADGKKGNQGAQATRRHFVSLANDGINGFAFCVAVYGFEFGIWGLELMGSEKLAGYSFGERENPGDPAAAEEGFQFLKLGQLLADGVVAFRVVGVVEGQFSWRGPSVGAGVVGFWQVIPNGSGWMVGLGEELVHGHLLVDGGILIQ